MSSRRSFLRHSAGAVAFLAAGGIGALAELATEPAHPFGAPTLAELEAGQRAVNVSMAQISEIIHKIYQESVLPALAAESSLVSVVRSVEDTGKPTYFYVGSI